MLTHCNTGALACGARGSALGVIMAMADRDPGLHVLVCETRPLLQGARLTTWELGRAGISHELIVDAAAAGLIRAGEAGAVVVGFDRMAANGDTANKVGTYGHALAARAAGHPVRVRGPALVDRHIAARRRGDQPSRSATATRCAAPAAPWSPFPARRCATRPSTSRPPTWSPPS